MSANVGTLDRALRLIVGVVLIVLPLITTFALWDNPVLKFGAMAVGAVMMLTAVVRFCPLYPLLGINTCSRR